MKKEMEKEKEEGEQEGGGGERGVDGKGRRKEERACG